MRHLEKFVKPMEIKLRSKIFDLRFPTDMPEIYWHKTCKGRLSYNLFQYLKYLFKQAMHIFQV